MSTLFFSLTHLILITICARFSLPVLISIIKTFLLPHRYPPVCDDQEWLAHHHHGGATPAHEAPLHTLPQGWLHGGQHGGPWLLHGHLGYVCGNLCGFPAVEASEHQTLPSGRLTPELYWPGTPQHPHMKQWGRVAPASISIDNILTSDGKEWFDNKKHNNTAHLSQMYKLVT